MRDKVCKYPKCNKHFTDLTYNHMKLFCDETCCDAHHTALKMERRRKLKAESTIIRQSSIRDRKKKERRELELVTSAHRSAVMTGDCADGYMGILDAIGVCL